MARLEWDVLKTTVAEAAKTQLGVQHMHLRNRRMRYTYPPYIIIYFSIGIYLNLFLQ